MSASSRKHRHLVAAAGLSALIALSGSSLTGCQSGANRSPQDAEEAAVQGNATPVPSPQSNDPAGDVIKPPAPMEKLSDTESIGATLAVRSDNALAVGSIDDFRQARATKVPLDPECGDVTTGPGKFVVPCGDEVLYVPADHPEDVTHVKVDEDFPVTAAAVTGSGDLFVTSRDSDEVAIYRDGSRIDNFHVESGSDQLLAVGNGDKPDGVVRTQRADTTIQSLDWENSRAGGRLRVGQGLGQAATSRDGVVVVSDTIGKRIAVYTDDDVVRLHQYGLTDGAPWAVAWDPQRRLAWALTTDNNQAQAFDVSTGVPEKRGQIDTVANALSMTVLDDGTVVAASASGDGIQVVKDPDLKTPKE